MHRIGLPYTQQVSMPAAARAAARAAQERSVRGSEACVGAKRAWEQSVRGSEACMGAKRAWVHNAVRGGRAHMSAAAARNMVAARLLRSERPPRSTTESKRWPFEGAPAPSASIGRKKAEKQKTVQSSTGKATL